MTIDIQRLTISGDRQHGKSHLLELLAIDEMRQGRRVLWLSPTLTESREIFYRTEQAVRRGVLTPRLIKNLEVQRANGQQSITLPTPDGPLDCGRISFGSTGQSRRGANFDTLLIDDPDADPVDIAEQVAPCMATSLQPRIVSTVTTGDPYR